MNARRIPLSLIVGALLVGVLALIALVSLAWLPYLIEDTSGGRLEGFSADHLLGTDRLGHDLASRMMVGARIALVVGLGAVAVATLIGVSVGLVIALARPWVDDVASALLDVLIAFPALLDVLIAFPTLLLAMLIAFPTLLLAMLIVAGFGASLATVTVAIGVAASAVVARLTRILARRVLAEQYVLAARTSGVSTWGILTRHVLPNIWPTLATNLAVTMGGAVLAEAGLSYLGLGAPPPNASWGRLLQDAQATFTTQPLGAIAPGVAIVAFVLGANLAADGLRSLIDPTQGGAK